MKTEFSPVGLLVKKLGLIPLVVSFGFFKHRDSEGYEVEELGVKELGVRS